MIKKQLKVIFISVYASLFFVINTWAGLWHSEGDKWQYQEGDSFTVNTWLLDQGNWYHFDEHGTMQTGWLYDNNTWYYLDHSGAMIANTSKSIDNVLYSFDASGKMLEQTVKSGWDGSTYNSVAFNFSIKLPADYTNIEPNHPNIHFALEKGTVGFASLSFPYDSNQNINRMIPEINDIILKGIGEEVGSSYQSEVNMGGYQFTKIQNYFTKAGNIDFYYRQSDSNLYCLITIYPTSESYKVGQVLRSLKKLY